MSLDEIHDLVRHVIAYRAHARDAWCGDDPHWLVISLLDVSPLASEDVFAASVALLISAPLTKDTYVCN